MRNELGSPSSLSVRLEQESDGETTKSECGMGCLHASMQPWQFATCHFRVSRDAFSLAATAYRCPSPVVVIKASPPAIDKHCRSPNTPSCILASSAHSNMPPKSKKTKAEEAVDFLSSLDNLDAPPSGETSSPVVADQAQSGAAPRASTDSARPKSIKSTTDLSSSQDLGRTGSPAPEQGDEEAQEALAFLQAQINTKTKRAPLSAPKASTPRSVTPVQVHAAADAGSSGAAVNVPTTGGGAGGVGGGAGGWRGSWWSSATSALQSAQKIADEGYKRVRTEGVAGVSEQLKGVDLNKMRQGAEQRLGGIVKGVDLERLRECLVFSNCRDLYHTDIMLVFR